MRPVSGYNFTKEILMNHKPKKIVIYSRDEYKQYKMQNDEFFKKFYQKNNYSNILRFFIGDIRDKERLKFAVKHNIDYVIHASALKQVPTCEYNPFEAVKTNILGAQNLIDVCLQKQNVYYKDLIKGRVLKCLEITVLKKNSFRKYMASEGKLGGQNKVPRLANNRNIADKLNLFSWKTKKNMLQF